MPNSHKSCILIIICFSVIVNMKNIVYLVGHTRYCENNTQLHHTMFLKNVSDDHNLRIVDIIGGIILM